VTAAEEAQQTFRAVLEALARPGRPFPLSGDGKAAVALALCDEDTPVWLDPVLAADGEIAGWFAFYTGAPVIAEPERASFLFVTGFDRLPPLLDLAAGTPEQPHRSATVVIDVTGAQENTTLRAEGPGINGYADFTAPWPAGFAELWRGNTDRFPMGVDLLLVDGDQVRGLPRTTHLDGAL
jgi:alpha-D-ribose 1-methylphosphonate 5-triphosphate synthase subunit PhnH